MVLLKVSKQNMKKKVVAIVQARMGSSRLWKSIETSWFQQF